MLGNHGMRAEGTLGTVYRYRSTVAVLVAVAVAAGVVASLAWTRPARTARKVSYVQRAQLTYSAQPGAKSVYGAAGLVTGEPIYTNTVSTVAVTYSYSIVSTVPADISGTEQLVATITNGQGVTRSVPLQAVTSFKGSKFTLPATLPVEQLAAIAQTFSNAAGQSSLYVVHISPNVRAQGRLAGAPIRLSFSPAVSFTLTNGTLVPNASGSTPAVGSKATTTVSPSSPVFNPSVPGVVTLPAATSAMLLGAPVSTLRMVALLIFVLSALGAALLGRSLVQTLTTLDERSRIAFRHRSSLIDVDSLPGDAKAVVVEISDFDGLTRVARQLECPILHLSDERGDDYVVVDNGTLYRFRLRAAQSQRVGRLVSGSSGREDGQHAAPYRDGARRIRVSGGE